MRFRTGAVLFCVLFGLAIYFSGRDQTSALYAIVAAIVVLCAGFDLKPLPPWLRVVVKIVYVCIGTVLLFLVLLFSGWIGP